MSIKAWFRRHIEAGRLLIYSHFTASFRAKLTSFRQMSTKRLMSRQPGAEHLFFEALTDTWLLFAWYLDADKSTIQDLI